MDQKRVIQSSYLNVIYKVDEYTKVVDDAVKIAMDVRCQHMFDTIAFSGHSGSAIAYPLSYRMGIPLICVRKSGENSHFVKENPKLLEGHMTTKKYVIVDDFISSGDTVRRMLKTIKDNLPNAECVGMIMFKIRDRDNFTKAQSLFNGIPIYGSLISAEF